jgi:hypothetical protein
MAGFQIDGCPFITPLTEEIQAQGCAKKQINFSR